jgi:uncharacterized YigZ family protein
MVLRLRKRQLCTLTTAQAIGATLGCRYAQAAMRMTLTEPVHSELVIKKSRFIGCVAPVAGRPEALQRVAQWRAEHPQSTHVCWALMAGGHSAAHDDGEPGGTAGRPMLEVLRHQGLEGVLATVVRYYGGTPLGAGGLVRAYTEAVAQALRGALTHPVVQRLTWCCDVPYPLEGRVRRAIDNAGAELMAMDSGEAARLWWTASVPQGQALRQHIDDLCSGRARWCDAPPPEAG